MLHYNLTTNFISMKHLSHSNIDPKGLSYVAIEFVSQGFSPDAWQERDGKRDPYFWTFLLTILYLLL